MRKQRCPAENYQIETKKYLCYFTDKPCGYKIRTNCRDYMMHIGSRLSKLEGKLCQDN